MILTLATNVSTYSTFYSFRCRHSTPRRCVRKSIPVPWHLEGASWHWTAEASPLFDSPVGNGNRGERTRRGDDGGIGMGGEEQEVLP